MVIGLFIITAIPTVTGIGQAYSAQKTAEEREKDKKRMSKFHIDVICDDPNPRKKILNGRRLVLRDDLVWIGSQEALNPSPEGYVAEAFYIEYPDNEVIQHSSWTYAHGVLRCLLTLFCSESLLRWVLLVRHVLTRHY